MAYMVLIAIVIALFWHAVVEHFVWATVSSTITGTLLVWLITASHFGWMDETFYENLALTLTITLTASLLVGFVFVRRRRARAHE